MNTPLPILPTVSIAALRSLPVGQTAAFSCEGSARTTVATNVMRLEGKYQQKTAIVIDPDTCQAVKILFVTRRS